MADKAESEQRAAELEEKVAEGVAAAAEVLDEVAPSGRDLVVSDPADRNEVFVVLDRHDERMILEAFQQRALDVMLYDFPQDGQRVVDLSVRGVLEAIDLMNRTGKCRIGIVPDAGALQVEEVRMDEAVQAANFDDRLPPVFVKATVWGRDEATGSHRTGMAMEPRFYVPKKGQNAGKVMWDKFAETKAINKAERNALAKFIPEPMRQTMIAQHKNDPAAIRRIQAGAGAEAVAELPAPLDDEKARRLVERARAVYLEIREVDPIAVLPGSFHERLLLSQHSHEALVAFVDRLEDKLRKVRDAA